MSPYSSNHWAGSVYNIHKRRDYKAERHVLTIHALLPETCYLNNYMLLAAKKQSTADHWRRWGVAVAGWDQALALLMGAVLRLGKQSWIRLMPSLTCLRDMTVSWRDFAFTQALLQESISLSGQPFEMLWYRSSAAECLLLLRCSLIH